MLNALTHPRHDVREAARDALLCPGTDALHEISRSAFAELGPRRGAFSTWCRVGATKADLLALLPEVRSSGALAAVDLVRALSRVAGESERVWARDALADPALPPALREPCLAVLLRAGEVPSDMDILSELDGAEAFHGGAQSLVVAGLDGEELALAIGLSFDLPGWGPRILTLAARHLLGIPTLAAAQLSDCWTAEAVIKACWVEDDAALAVMRELSAEYEAALTDEVNGWARFVAALGARLDHLSKEGGPPGGWRSKARVLHKLMRRQSFKAPVAQAAMLLAATARLASFPDDDAHFEEDEEVPLSVLLDVASRPHASGHPLVVDALVAKGPGVVPELVAALHIDAYWRSYVVVQALTKLAWQHPGCADGAVDAVMPLYWDDSGDLLIDKTATFFETLTPAAVPALVGASEAHGKRNYSLSRAIGRLGGPEAKAFLLGHVDDAFYEETGVLHGLLKLGDPDAIPHLAQLEGEDPSAEVARALVILCGLTGEEPDGLDDWTARVEYVELERQRRQEELRELLMAAASRESMFSPPTRAERRQSGGKKPKRRMPRRKKGKRRKKK